MRIQHIKNWPNNPHSPWTGESLDKKHSSHSMDTFCHFRINPFSVVSHFVDLF
jgi:hypothetical protein